MREGKYYICEFCGYYSRKKSDVIKHEASHRGCSVESYKSYLTQRSKLTEISNLLNTTVIMDENISLKDLFDKLELYRTNVSEFDSTHPVRNYYSKERIRKNYNNIFNYTNNMNLHQMKPIERKLFRYLMRQFNYDVIGSIRRSRRYDSGKYPMIKPMDFLITEFADKYNISDNMINYILSKWIKCGFYKSDDDVLKRGYFVHVNVLIGLDYKASSIKYKNYIDIVPNRVKVKVLEATNKNDISSYQLRIIHEKHLYTGNRYFNHCKKIPITIIVSRYRYLYFLFSRSFYFCN